MSTADFDWKSCPVSGEEFKHPLNLPCGHTFDKTSIEKFQKKECPDCRNPFQENIDQLMINWHLVRTLNLTIPRKEEDKIERYTALQAKRDLDNAIKKYNQDLLDSLPGIMEKVYNDIRLAITTRKNEIWLGDYTKGDIKPLVIKQLKEDGYGVNNGWSNGGCTIHW